jgi:hypothetical protein
MRPYLNAGDRYDVAEGGMIVAEELREVMQEHCKSWSTASQEHCKELMEVMQEHCAKVIRSCCR